MTSGHRSRVVRAANLNKIYTGPNSVWPAITDPFRNSESNVLRLNTGNPNLDAERGDTFTVGIVYPLHLPGNFDEQAE